MSTKATVIYHSADFDGLFCREIARKFLPDAELVGWDFGQPALEIPNGPIYVLDLPLDAPFGFNYNETDKERGPQHPPGLVWIDHHKSSICSHPTDIPGYRIDGVAACRLAWAYFTAAIDDYALILPSKQEFISRLVSEPLAVRLAGEYDVWDKRDPHADIFQHGLRSRELTPEVWAQLLDDGVDSALQGTGMDITPSEQMAMVLIEAGSAIQYAKTHENESIIKTAGFDLDFEGLHFLACNHARYNSFLFTAGLKPEHDACLGFAWKGGKWTVSLYHAPGKEHHDLSLIAVKHGGGGHRGACGFRGKTLPFNLN
jgi:hypothetical protein